jgi:hypothetical protein
MAEQIATSVWECAQLLGTTAQTVYNWLGNPTFPGRKGDPLTRTAGYFPIEQIRQWRITELADTGRPQGEVVTQAVAQVASIPANGGGNPLADQKQSERLRTADDHRLAKALIAMTEAKRAELKLAKEIESIVDADDVKRLIMRLVAGAKAILEEMPDRVLARLPSDTTEGTRRLIRDEVANCVRLTAATLAEMRTGDTDESR